MSLNRSDREDVTVTVSDMLVASADSSDLLLDGAVEDVLQVLRERLKLDVVFVAEFVDGKRVFRFVDRTESAPAVEPGGADDLEASFCQRVVDGRLPEFIPDAARLGPGVDVPPLPFRVGTHLSTPVVLQDGSVFGTLCCFSTAPNPDVQAQDLVTLRHCAKLVARKLELAGSKGLKDPPANWAQQSPPSYGSDIWKLRGVWKLGSEGQRAWLNY